VLIILDAITGTLLKKIDTGVGGCNGLATPVCIDVPKSGNTFDSRVDYVYAGDLKGNLWKFDLTSSNPDDWDIAYYEDTTPQPVFQARGAGGIMQPIVTKPDVMLHPETNFGYFVLFGTGRYFGDTDLQNTSVQTIYGIWDYGDDDDDTEYIGTFNRTGTPQLSNMPDSVTMVEQKVVPCDPDSVTDCSGDYWFVEDEHGEIKKTRILTAALDDPILYSLEYKTTTANSDGTACGDFGGVPCDPNDIGDNPDPIRNIGWFFDLPESGERVVSDVLLREKRLIAIGYMPKQTPCGSGGDSIVMELDAITGGRVATPVFDINSDGVIDYRDLINIGTEENPIWVAPSGLENPGRLLPPAILQVGQGREIKYFSSSRGTIETVMERAVRMGISYWKEYE
jgi:type IV pilus assembly protein PilY1